MPASHPRPWHRAAEFGLGPRVPLCRERRAQWRARLDLHRRAGRLTALHTEVGRALLRRLGEDGRCDPSHDALAADAGASPRTVRRALDGLRACGLVRWAQRLVRDGWRAAQTSNAYALNLGEPAPILPRRCDGQAGRETEKIASIPTPDPEAVTAARRALATIQAARTKKVAREWLARRGRCRPTG